MNIHDATAFLRAHGYVVVPGERVVTMRNQAVITDFAVHTNLSSFLEHTIKTMATHMGIEAVREGLVTKTDEYVNDIYEGRTRVIRMSASFIKPPEDK